MNTLTRSAGPAPDVIPRRGLLAGLALAGGALAMVGALRAGGYIAADPEPVAVRRRRLRFVDLADGAIAVSDADSGELLDVMRGEQGFLRGALRGLTRERRLRGVPVGEPMVLSGSADGRLSLADPATGQRLALESFGPSNAAVFARWLQAT